MKTTVVAAIGALVMMSAVPAQVVAQEEAPPVTTAAAATTAAQPEVAEGHLVKRFVRDVIGDYAHFISWDTAETLGVGGFAALAVHPADEDLHQKAENGDLPNLAGGAEWGSQYLQIPLSVGLWAIGAAAGSGNTAEAGRDMLRAQISAASWSYAMKYAVSRTRPNGDPRSFPSGHSTTAFATATVLQTHYGWKLGVPAYAIASYTAMSRVFANQHWASDVTFGAFVGIACGRTVTVHLRGKPMALRPVPVPGGGAIVLTTTR